MVRINGIDVAVSENPSLSIVLSENGYNVETVVVELNGEVVTKGQFTTRKVEADDVLEVLNFVGGG